MKRIIFSAAAILLSVTSLLLIAELVLRWREEGSVRAVWGTLTAGEVPFSEFAGEGWFVADPALGYRLNPTRSEVNALGLMHPEIPPGTLGGLPRVIVLGDSVAQDESSFASLVGEELEGRAEVINAAIPGYTTYQERLLLERYLLPLEPDVVILQYCTNDHHKFLHRFDSDSGMLFTEEARRVLLPEEGDPLGWLPRGSYLAFRIRFALLKWRTKGGNYPWERSPDVAPAWKDSGWAEFRRQLVAMKSLLAETGSRLTVVMAPYRPQFDSKLLSRDRSYVLRPQSMMAETCDDLGVPLLDLYPVLSAEGGGALFRDDYHLTGRGHEVVAHALLKHLDSNDFYQRTEDLLRP